MYVVLALSLRHVQAFFLMVFQGNCARSRTGHTIKLLIVSITNFSFVIGSPRAYLSRNRRVITWVSDLNFFKAWIFFQIFLRSSKIYFTYLLRSNVYKLLGALRNNWRSYVIFKGIHVHKQHISKSRRKKKTAERQKKDRGSGLKRTSNELVESVFTYKPPWKGTLTESIAESDSHSSKSDEEVWEELDDSEDEDECQWKLY